MQINAGEWYRTCQECGHEQRAKEPNRSRELTKSYLESKCRACGSPSLDYGTFYTSDNYATDDMDKLPY